MEKGVTTEEMTTDGIERGIIELKGSYDCSSSEIKFGTDLL